MSEKVSMHRVLAVLLLVVACAVTACASKPPKPTGSEAGTANTGAEGAGAGNANANGSGSDDEIAGPQAGMLAKRTVYFDFDSSVIKGDGTDIVAAHAKYLSDHADARVRLEGNTDERGSPEYNIGLGMRRAQAVRQALLLQGASAGQITVVSYGAEHPVDPAHNEDAWAKNRRVDIVYLTPGMQVPAAPQAPQPPQ